MSFLKIIITLSFLLMISSTCFAVDKMVTREYLDSVRFNDHVIHMNSEVGIFLHSLDQINANDTVEVKKFMEHKLDEMVCASGKMLGKMGKSQKKRTLALLQRIKQYRANNPRFEHAEVDTEGFSPYFAPFDNSYAQRADEILARLD